MPVTYTNYKGDRYILYKKETIYGTFQYYFAKSSDKGMPCRTIPDGYEIRESVNGRVSLAKIRPVLLSAAEIQIVANLLDNHLSWLHFPSVPRFTEKITENNH